MQPSGQGGPSGAELAGLGGLVAGVVVVPLVAGLLLDGALRTGSIFLIVGLVVGIVGAAATVYMRFRRYL
jgi:F0F1-type ATP synthase assembly protein I